MTPTHPVTSSRPVFTLERAHRIALQVAPVTVACLAFLLAGTAMAGGSTGSLPWETGLATISDSITGPVAYAASLLLIVGTGIGAAFGGDMSGMLKTVLGLGFAIGIIGFAAQFLNLMGLSGALLL